MNTDIRKFSIGVFGSILAIGFFGCEAPPDAAPSSDTQAIRLKSRVFVPEEINTETLLARRGEFLMLQFKHFPTATELEEAGLEPVNYVSGNTLVAKVDKPETLNTLDNLSSGVRKAVSSTSSRLRPSSPRW